MATLAREGAPSTNLDDPIPTFRWWPGGLPMHISDADPTANSVVVSFEAPGHPSLARWPLGSEPLESWRRHDGYHHAHQYTWTDARWHWALRCDIELDDDDVIRIADSMIDVGSPA